MNSDQFPSPFGDDSGDGGTEVGDCKSIEELSFSVWRVVFVCNSGDCPLFEVLGWPRFGKVRGNARSERVFAGAKDPVDEPVGDRNTSDRLWCIYFRRAAWEMSRTVTTVYGGSRTLIIVLTAAIPKYGKTIKNGLAKPSLSTLKCASLLISWYNPNPNWSKPAAASRNIDSG